MEGSEMKKIGGWVIVLLLVSTGAGPGEKLSLELEHLTWIEAEKALAAYDVVLIALGARSKEHGPHLRLNNDYLMAEYLKDRVAAQVPVAVLPTLQYGYYPAFLDYPGSISLRPETFRDMVVDIARSMSGYGIRKVYVLNTGVSTLGPLQQARENLASEKIELRFLNILEVDEGLPEGLLQQEGGTHADEGETSMMLYIAPESVDMSLAVKDYDPRPNRPGLSRKPEGRGSYSPSGIWGDPTLATREKGRIIVEHTVSAIVSEVRELIDLELE
jgi:creatinine amidohydrolase